MSAPLADRPPATTRKGAAGTGAPSRAASVATKTRPTPYCATMALTLFMDLSILPNRTGLSPIANDAHGRVRALVRSDCRIARPYGREHRADIGRQTLPAGKAA